MHAAVASCILWGAAASAQVTVTRAEAVESALSRGARLAIAISDTSVARARLLGAKARQNPALNAAYSKSPPHFHFTVDLPIDLPALRNARQASASAVLRGANYRLSYERAAAALDADTGFTRALAARAHVVISSRNAYVADTLLQMAVARRDAGDASDLEVELAKVNAGQQHNVATSDSLQLVGTLIDLQSAMGIASGTAELKLLDTLSLPDAGFDSAIAGTPLLLASSLESITAAERNIRIEKLSMLGSPSLMGGIETGDPGGTEKGILPTFGFSIPIPLLNRNRAGIAQASAELQRAKADYRATNLEYNATVNRMRRQRTTAYARAVRDRSLLESANRVASMSVIAYRAGAVPLSNVFEAQRTARDIISQYVDDLAEIWIADAALRVLTITSTK